MKHFPPGTAKNASGLALERAGQSPTGGTYEISARETVRRCRPDPSDSLRTAAFTPHHVVAMSRAWPSFAARELTAGARPDLVAGLNLPRKERAGGAAEISRTRDRRRSGGVMTSFDTKEIFSPRMTLCALLHHQPWTSISL